MTLHQAFATLLTIVLTLGPTFAQQKKLDSNRDGTITGRVVNESGQPLSNVAVSLRPYGASSFRRESLTDREGKFQFKELPAQVYLISTGLPAYIPAPRDPDNTQSTSYRVGDDVTLIMIKGGVITGKVITSSNEPVVGVRVRVQMIRDSFGQRTRYGATAREVITDDRGVYRTYGLVPGSYVVMAGGGPIGLVSYRNDASTYAPSGTRDTASEVAVLAGQETSDVDIRYRGDQGYAISGAAVTPPGSEVNGFFVRLTSTVDGGSQLSESVYQAVGQSFSFFGVPDGDYDVTAQTIGNAPGRGLSEPKRIKVRGADVTGVELVTRSLASISGRVVLESSNAPECKDRPRAVITETLVSAWHNEKEVARDQPQFVWSLGGPVYPDQKGELTLRDLAAGQYLIASRIAAKDWYLKSITLPPTAGASPSLNKQTDAVGNWISVRSGDRLSGLTVTLAEGAGSLQGEIKLNEGEALPARLYVYLVPAETENEKDVLRFLAAPVTSDRKVALNHIPPGSYWIVLQPALDGPTPTLTRLRLPDEKVIRARLRREAEQVKNEVEIKPCQNLVDYNFTLKSSSGNK